MSRHKVEDLSHQVHSLSQVQLDMSTSQQRLPYDNTFGESEAKDAIKTINITDELRQEGVEHMVLDLDLLKQELMETQHQFNSTREDLELERHEK